MLRLSIRSRIVPCPDYCRHSLGSSGDDLSTTKVRQYNPPFNSMRSHKNVLWFEVAMNDVVIMKVVYSDYDLLNYRSRLEIRDTTALRLNKGE